MQRRLQSTPHGQARTCCWSVFGPYRGPCVLDIYTHPSRVGGINSASSIPTLTLTIGAISKRWAVPGWRLGWIATCDPKGILKETKVSHSLRSFGMLTTDPATFVEGAIPHIMKNTNDEFFSKIVNLLKETAEICYDEIKEMKCIICPNKPEGSFFLMVKLEVSQLTDISDDIDFCRKLAKEESVMLLPGAALGMENWLRITFATEPPKLKQGLERVKHFCQRHQSQNN